MTHSTHLLSTHRPRDKYTPRRQYVNCDAIWPSKQELTGCCCCCKRLRGMAPRQGGERVWEWIVAAGLNPFIVTIDRSEIEQSRKTLDRQENLNEKY